MKNLNQLIASFEVKASQDDYAVVSREDLEQAVRYLKESVKSREELESDVAYVPLSLNSRTLVNPFRPSGSD